MEEKIKQFLDKMIELQDWNIVAQFMQYLDYDFIMKHKYDFPWGLISNNIEIYHLPDWVFHACSDLLDWKTISKQKLNDNFIHEHKEKLDWDWVLRNKQFNESFIREHLPYIKNFDVLISSQLLSEEFLLEFKDSINWDRIIYRRYFSIEFLREVKDYINWKYFLWSGRLTEEHLREFDEYLDWEAVCEYQTISEDFIKEHWDKMDFKKLLLNNHLCLNHKFIKEFVKEKIDRWTINGKSAEIVKLYGASFYNELIMLKNEQENYHG